MFSGNLIFNLSITLTSQQLTIQPPVDHRATCWPFSHLLALEPAPDFPASRPLFLYNSKQLTLQPTGEPQPLADQAFSSSVLILQPPANPSATCWPFSHLLTLQQAADLPASRPSSNNLLSNSQQLTLQPHASPNHLLTKTTAAECWPSSHLLALQSPADPPASRGSSSQ